MKKLLITNQYHFHYEIIESVIVKYREILNIAEDIPIEIYLHVLTRDIAHDSFIKYIKNKYTSIKFQNIKDFDYYINCTIYDNECENIERQQHKTHMKFISHEVSNRLKNNPDVFFLTPLSKQNYFYADILPFAESKSKIMSTVEMPIYIVQGNLNQNRRYWDLLREILENTYTYDFKIKLIGYGTMPDQFKQYQDKLIVKSNLNFIQYHKEFLDTYCILPLISKDTHPDYYQKKLTSTINYARGYQLKCLLDQDLQDIYQLQNVEIYNNIKNIVHSFTNTLKDFYTSTH